MPTWFFEGGWCETQIPLQMALTETDCKLIGSWSSSLITNTCTCGTNSTDYYLPWPMLLNVHLYCMICTIVTILILYTYSNSSTGNHLFQSVIVFYHLLPSVSSCYLLLTSAPLVTSVNLTLIPTPVPSVTISHDLLQSSSISYRLLAAATVSLHLLPSAPLVLPFVNSTLCLTPLPSVICHSLLPSTSISYHLLLSVSSCYHFLASATICYHPYTLHLISNFSTVCYYLLLSVTICYPMPMLDILLSFQKDFLI